MPKFNGRVVAVENNGEPVWQSPDGQRKLWKVTVDVNGNQAEVSTFSGKLAQVGFNGEMESYERTNNQGGNDTFVKQPQQEQPAGGYRGNSGSGFKAAAPRDNFTMYLSYSKDIAVALIGQGIIPSDAAFADLLKQGLAHVSVGGHFLHGQRPDAENAQTTTTAPAPTTAPAVPTAQPVPAELNSLFGQVEDTNTQGSPWPINPQS